MSLTPVILSYYAQQPSATMVANASVAVSDLERLTDETYGLLYSLPGVWGWISDHADVALNCWAAWLVDGSKLDAASVRTLNSGP